MADTSKTPDTGSRYVVTTKTTGWLSLRYVPREPRPVRVDTRGQS